QLQPTAEILINTDSVRLQARSERLNTDASRGRSDTTSSLERSWGAFEWRPSGLPVFDIHAQHNVNMQAGASVALTDDLASAGLRYEWHGLQARAEERYIRSRDPGLGYDRKTTSHLGDLSYSLSTFGGRFTVGTSGAAQLTSVAERALNGGTRSLPVPVSIARAFRTVDDTPNDNRDRSEEHTSALQSPDQLVCRLLLEKKKQYLCLRLWSSHRLRKYGCAWGRAYL